MTDNLQPIPLHSPLALRPADDPKANRGRYFLLRTAATWWTRHGSWEGRSRGSGPVMLHHSGAFCWFVDVDFADGALGHLDLHVPVRGDFQEGFEIRESLAAFPDAFTCPGSTRPARSSASRSATGNTAACSARTRTPTGGRSKDSLPASLTARPSLGPHADRRPGRRASPGRHRPIGRDAADWVRLDDVTGTSDGARDFRRDVCSQGTMRPCTTNRVLWITGDPCVQLNFPPLACPRCRKPARQTPCHWVFSLFRRAITCTFDRLRHIQSSSPLAGRSRTTTRLVRSLEPAGLGLPLARHPDHHPLHWNCDPKNIWLLASR